VYIDRPNVLIGEEIFAFIFANTLYHAPARAGHFRNSDTIPLIGYLGVIQASFSASGIPGRGGSKDLPPTLESGVGFPSQQSPL
jgi:hypothetical protein